MAVIQLSGGSTKSPAGALNIRLSMAQGAELVLLAADGSRIEPSFIKTATDVVVVPDQPFTVVARCQRGAAFAEGTRIGVSIRSVSGEGDEVVRLPADASSRNDLPLVEITQGEILDCVAEQGTAQQGWRQPGQHAYHVRHSSRRGGARDWVAVIDGSTTRGVDTPKQWHALLELVLGIASAAYGQDPNRVLWATQPPIDLTTQLSQSEVDWDSVLPSQPAAWSRLGGAVENALATLPDDGAVVLISDGVFVDYREVAQLIGQREHVVVALGRSRFGVRPSDQIEQFWHEELAALEIFSPVAALNTLTLTSADEVLLADAMFPRSEA